MNDTLGTLDGPAYVYVTRPTPIKRNDEMTGRTIYDHPTRVTRLHPIPHPSPDPARLVNKRSAG